MMRLTERQLATAACFAALEKSLQAFDLRK
jgi:hypothetical protein